MDEWETIRQALKDCGLSTYAIGRITGVNQKTAHRYVNGQRMPPFDVAVRLARAVGLRVAVVPDVWKLPNVQRRASEKGERYDADKQENESS